MTHTENFGETDTSPKFPCKNYLESSIFLAVLFQAFDGELRESKSSNFWKTVTDDGKEIPKISLTR